MTRRRSKTRIPTDIEQALQQLHNLPVDGVRKRWSDWLNEAAPRCQSKEVLRGLLAWRIQEQRYGGMSREAKRRLAQSAPTSNIDKPTPMIAPPVSLRPGTMLTKEWRGVMYRVHVLESGYAYEGKTYSSLSAVARRIAGTRWSGPRFFGLEAKGQAPSAGRS